MNARQREVAGDIGRVMVAFLLLGVFVTTLAVAPGLGIALKEFGLKRRYKDRSVGQAVYRLQKRGWVTMRRQGDETVVELTREGKRIALKYKAQSMKLKRPKKWDGKWRLVFFDIPEKNRRARDAFRAKLNELGFYQIQKSVFVHPYSCERELVFLRELYDISPHVHIAVSHLLEKQSSLRSHFNV